MFTDGRTTDRGSEKLTWIFSSGKLKRANDTYQIKSENKFAYILLFRGRHSRENRFWWYFSLTSLSISSWSAIKDYSFWVIINVVVYSIFFYFISKFSFNNSNWLLLKNKTAGIRIIIQRKLRQSFIAFAIHRPIVNCITAMKVLKL